MIQKFQAGIRKRKLLLPGQRALVAVSGGADSVALLLALKESAPLLKAKLVVAHLNHLIRGRAAYEDAAFVRALARRMNIPFVGGAADVPRLARRKGISIEMAAREARYAFLVRAARKAEADAILTAHTADDQAETVILRLARGTSLRGLAGIPRDTVINGGRVVRPMLDISRKEILEFLRERRAAWREDETNLDEDHLRNRARHEILPLMESLLNPRIRQAFARTADALRDDDTLLSEMAERIKERAMPCRNDLAGSENAIAISKLRRSHPALRRRVLLLWLISLGISPEAVDYDLLDRLDAALMTKKGGCAIEVGGGMTIEKRYDLLLLRAGREPVANFRKKLKPPGATLLKEPGLVVTASLKPGLIKQKGAKIGHFPARASIGRTDALKRGIIVRSWKAGDKMKPLGMAGTKKLQDIFVDEKVPLADRWKIPVFESRGEIIWLPGYRVARGWEVTNPGDTALQIVVERSSVSRKKVFVRRK